MKKQTIKPKSHSLFSKTIAKSYCLEKRVFNALNSRPQLRLF